MKKRYLFISTLLITCSLLTGCMIGPGLSDYRIPLINNYEVVRLSNHHIIIGKLDSIIEDGSWQTIIPPKVLKIGYDHRYIATLIQPTEDLINVEEVEEKQVYYLIDTETDEVIGPLSKQEYQTDLLFSHIELKPLEDYEKIYD